MDVIEEAKIIYNKKMEEWKEIENLLNDGSLQKLERRNLITIHKENIPTEEEILHDSFHSAACKHLYENLGLYVYVGEFVYLGKRWGFRSYLKTNTSNWDEEIPADYERRVKKYVELFSGRGKIVYPCEYEQFRQHYTLIHLPYTYTITEVNGLYLIGKWPLVQEAFETDGFCEQFRAIQNYYFRSILNDTSQDAINDLQNEKTLQKICIRK